jgi:uncharacterized membrane protein
MKEMAKAQLGNQIFGNTWLTAVIVVLIQSAVTYLINCVLGFGQIVSILVLGPLSYGMAAMFLKQTRDGNKMEIGDIFNGFKEDFSNTFLIGLMTFIFTFLWSLLFVIPGIVKSYAYSMAYYIKADHPEYDWKQCINESQRMMQGHKGELFVLDLSFIGWYIVGSLCLGVGVLWVSAYVAAARSQFYENLRLTELKTAPQFDTQQF